MTIKLKKLKDIGFIESKLPKFEPNFFKPNIDSENAPKLVGMASYPELFGVASYKNDNGNVNLPEGHDSKKWLDKIQNDFVHQTLDKNLESILTKMGVKFELPFFEGLGQYCSLKTGSKIIEGSHLYNWCKKISEKKKNGSLKNDEEALLKF